MTLFQGSDFFFKIVVVPDSRGQLLACLHKFKREVCLGFLRLFESFLLVLKPLDRVLFLYLSRAKIINFLAISLLVLKRDKSRNNQNGSGYDSNYFRHGG